MDDMLVKWVQMTASYFKLCIKREKMSDEGCSD